MAVDLYHQGRYLGSVACSGASIIVRDADGAPMGQVADLLAALALLSPRPAV